MAELPIMPLRIAPLLSDTSHMTAEEFGAYVRLLCAMWLHRARLPNIPDELARIAGVARTRWDEIAPCVMRPMTRTDDAVSQQRLTTTWMRASAQRKRFQKMAAKRWQSRQR